MTKVRIYELAKEAGLKSKEFADKLIELGYPIKSHSSTVDDDIAADIRRKVIGTTTVEVTDQRIEIKRPGIDRPVTTVVRRRSKADKEEIARRAEEEEAEHAAEELEEEVEAAAIAEEEIVQPAEESEVRTEEVSAHEEAGVEPAAAEEESLVQAEAQPEEIKAEPVPQPAVDSRAELRKKPKKLAKVVGMVDIEIPSEKKSKPPRRPVRTVVVGERAPAVPAREPEHPEVRGKKGKRFVSLVEEDDRARKPGKLQRKGRQRIDFTAGGEAEFMRPRKGRKKKDGGRKEMEAPMAVAETRAIKKRIKVFETISVGDLARRMGVKASEVIAKLMKLGVLATLNQALDVESATLVAADFGFEVEQGVTQEMEVINLEEQEQGGELVLRPPVVTVMGHVDHGKTSILDAIRKTDVALGEAGGITQHIGAYHVQAPSGDIVFVDTPGHAAFTEMRSRGAKVTDIVVLVVAADDGVMEQTKEAIAHARAAEVPIVVAINKIDKDNANPDRVKRELGDFGLIPEEWGGDTIYCETSAKRNIGIEKLLENIQVQAEILELKANPYRKARGTVIEAQLHKGRGPVATVLVQEGTLRAGDYFVAGQFAGKVRTLIDDRGAQVQEAGPSMPVEVQGLSGVPQAGDEFVVVTDEKMAKNVSESRQLKAREHELAAASKVSLDNLFEKMAEQDLKELRVVLRADVQGTLEAFGQAAEKLSTKEIRVRVLHEGSGSITENDVHLAAASDAIIIGFNVRPPVKVKELAQKEQVDIRFYDVIYHALEDIEKAMLGMLEPTFEERVIGTAEVRQTFHVPKVGTVAGCSVIDGKIERAAKVRLMRDGVVIYTGNIASLRRFKDDVKEVPTGYECGIGVENFNDIKTGDHIEAFVLDRVEAKL
ncbi:MAG TPA: translation initiation factor IF-2 [Desulfobulbaceae bacterium]|nr:translation initiation factor IF-2 [Desulfobulbaceae bacterium]